MQFGFAESAVEQNTALLFVESVTTKFNSTENCYSTRERENGGRGGVWCAALNDSRIAIDCHLLFLIEHVGLLIQNA